VTKGIWLAIAASMDATTIMPEGGEEIVTTNPED